MYIGSLYVNASKINDVLQFEYGHYGLQHKNVAPELCPVVLLPDGDVAHVEAVGGPVDDVAVDLQVLALHHAEEGTNRVFSKALYR
jgi:hypothetical protein